MDNDSVLEKVVDYLSQLFLQFMRDWRRARGDSPH
jgi:hypothetical protein